MEVLVTRLYKYCPISLLFKAKRFILCLLFINDNNE